MMRVKSVFVLSVILATGAMSCSHVKQEKEIDQKLSEESDVQNRADLSNEASQLIETTPGLSDQQRAQLRELQGKTRTQATELRQQSLQLRALLIQELLSKDYNAREVNSIKKRIRKVEDQNIALIFGAVDKTNTIMGRANSNNPALVRNMLLDAHLQ